MKKAWIGAALAASLLLAGCEKEVTPAPELLEPVGVEIDTAVCRYDDIRNVEVYSSAVVPACEGLFLSVDGTVEEMLCLPGDKVEAGQALLTLDVKDLEKQEEALEKNLEYARQSYAYQNEQAELGLEMQRLTLAHRQGMGDASEEELRALTRALEDGELTLKQNRETQALEMSILEEQIADLEKRLSQTVLYAPFSGTVSYCMPLTKGSFLAAFTPAVYLADDDDILLTGDYISVYQLRWAKSVYALIGGRQYSITPVEQDEKQIISDIWAGFSPTSSFTIDEGQEKPRMGDYAAIVVETQKSEHALVVPTNAVYKDVGGQYVYVITDSGSRVRRGVVTGVSNDAYTEIREGLEEGAVIYVQE